MKLTLYLIILVLLSGCVPKKKYHYETSDFRPELRKHLEKLATNKEIPYNQDSVIRNYLKDSCSKEELLKILNCENPILRVIAYRAIINRNEPEYFKILFDHLDDTSKVFWWVYDDFAQESNVSDLMIGKAINENKLSKSQKDILIEEILHNHIFLGTAWWMMTEMKPLEKYYSIIKKQALIKSTDCHDLNLTTALAKYKKREDLKIIKSNFSNFSDNQYCNSYIFKAIEIFPDTSLFPLLSKYFETEIKKKKQETYDDLKYYCRAVSIYRNKNSLNILTKLTKDNTYPDNWYLPYNKKYVLSAIQKYNSPIYNNLQKGLMSQIDSSEITTLNILDHYDEETTW